MSRCPDTDLPGRVLLPGSSCSPSLTSKSGHIQAGTSALARREPGGEGPHLRGRMGSRSSHGCGLGAGWAGLVPRGQYLCEHARATGKGAAWRRNGWRREKRLPLGRRGFSSPLPTALRAASQHAHLSPWDRLLPRWDKSSPGLHGQEKQLSGPRGSGDRAAKLSHHPETELVWS